MQSDVYYTHSQMMASRSLKGPRPIQQQPTFPPSYKPRQPRKPLEVRVPMPKRHFEPQPPPQPYVYPSPKPQMTRRISKTEISLEELNALPSPAPSSSTKTIDEDVSHRDSVVRRKKLPPRPEPKSAPKPAVTYKTPATYYSSDDEDDNEFDDETILRDLTLSRRMSVHDITISSDEEEDDEEEERREHMYIPKRSTASDLPPIPTISAPDYDEEEEEEEVPHSKPTAKYNNRKTDDLPPIPAISAPGYSDDEDDNKGNMPPIPTICAPGGFSDEEEDSVSYKHQQSKRANPLYNSLYFGIRCGGCEEPLSGQAITTSGKHWHPRCFRCQACHQNLEHIAFYEKDSLPYCALDYHELFSPRCDFCKTPIEEHSISALGKTYHAGHFFCRECGKPFDEETNFLEHDGHAYCEKDYYKQFGKACKGCEEIITGDFLVALGGEWHKECFVCADCGSTFTSSTFLIKGGKPYCEEHYDQQSTMSKRKTLPRPKILKPLPNLDKMSFVNSKSPEVSLESTSSGGDEKNCHRCQKPVTGRCNSAFGYDYHPLHFQCSVCDKILSARFTGLYQETGDGELICKPCHRKN